MQRDVLREIERLEGELSRIAGELAELKKHVPGAPRRKTQAFTRPPPSPPPSDRSGPRSVVSPSSAPESLLGPPPPPPSSVPAPALGAGTQTEGTGIPGDRWDEPRPTASSPTPPSDVRPTPSQATPSRPTPSRRQAVEAGRYEFVGDGRRRR